MRRGIAALAFVCVLVLPACNRREPLPQGSRTARGTLERVEISLTRRGTHALAREGEQFTYVESPTVDLHALEGRTVELQGTYEENTDRRDLPVFVVTKVTGGAVGQKRAWTIPSLGVSFSVPREWKGDVTKSVARFTVSGSTLPMLRVLVETADALPFDFRTLTSSGTDLRLMPLVIGTRKAVTVETDGQPSFTVYVDLDAASATDDRLLAFVFRLEEDADVAAIQREDALGIVRSLAFRASSAPRATTPQSGTGSAAEGKPCGGPAGVLCPSGYSCQITDAATDIGVCKRL